MTAAAAPSAAPAEVASRPRRTRAASKTAEAAVPSVESEVPAKPKRARAPRKAAPEA